MRFRSSMICITKFQRQLVTKMNQNLRFIGRHIIKNNKDYFAYSGCGFEFILQPKSNNCSFVLSLISEVREHEFQYIAIYVDDVFYSKEKLIKGHNTVKVELKNKTKPVMVRVIKQNEVYLSSVYLEDIELNNAEFANIEPSKKKLIGFYGDSLTCGYGLIDYKGETFKMETEEFDKSYGYLAAKELDMDYSVVARSGISIAIKIYCDWLFKEIYDTVDMLDKCVPERPNDFAVVNLGANDNSGYSQLTKEEEKKVAINSFVEEYIALIKQIIADNPNVKVLICYDMAEMNDVIISAIKKAYDYIKTHYPNKCRLVEFIPNNEGANSHPYFTAHKVNSEILVKAIKELE